MSAHLPVIIIEVELFFGGALAFGWWQLRSVRKDQRKAAEERAAQETNPRRRRGSTRVLSLTKLARALTSLQRNKS